MAPPPFPGPSSRPPPGPPPGTACIGFTPDEGVGRGTWHFHVARFRAQYAYTLDGGRRGEIEIESFSADAMTVTFHGFNTHPGYAKGRMVNAIKVAAAFIDRLPLGLQTPVAERGATLSVGQKQLLSFARALAFDPRVLILDEAPSSVDTETELLIRDALKVVMRERTTIAIAHRLSTIQDMDRILVLHKGQLREAGTHQALLAQRGIYHRPYQLPFKDDAARA